MFQQLSGSFGDAIRNGDLRAQLVALRDHLADALEACHTMRDVGPIAAQLRQVLIDLDAMPVGSEVSVVDEIAAARAARLAQAADSPGVAV